MVKLFKKELLGFGDWQWFQFVVQFVISIEWKVLRVVEDFGCFSIVKFGQFDGFEISVDDIGVFIQFFDCLWNFCWKIKVQMDCVLKVVFNVFVSFVDYGFEW